MKNHYVREEIALHKFGAPVHYISSSKLSNGAPSYLEFAKVEMSEGKARVEFRYPVEGITGSVEFSKQGGGWVIERQNIVEH